jgi:hypothetical protein
MKLRIVCLVVAVLTLSFSLPPLTFAQTSTPTASALPRLVRFGGTAKDLNGSPMTGVVGITFALYSEQSGGVPLWLETQNATADSTGHYTVLLGSTKPEGLPSELFTSEQARWVGVQVSGQAEQPRVLLVSAPYALKAGDAETIGGLPPSAFVLAAPVAMGSGTSSITTATVPPPAATDVTTTGGTLNYLPIFSGAATIIDSAVFQTGSGATAKVGINTTTPVTQLDVNGAGNIRGTLSLPATGVATAAGGKNSQGLNIVASSFSSTSSTALNQVFRWQAEPVGNDTTAPSGTLNLQYGLGATTPTETGLKISSKGVLTFATGQTFPGTGDGSVTSIATGLGLKGGTITKAGTLTIDTTVVPQLKANNTFTGTQSITGSLGINTTSPAETLDVSSGNAIVRGTGNFKTTGNTATLYIGDTSHPIEAMYSTGLAIGVFKAPTALFIADFTGNVGIGTTTPTTGILNTAANTQSVIGLSTVGWNATSGSNLSGTDALHASGGNGDPNNSENNGGIGAVVNGGSGLFGSGGAGAVITGGTGSGTFGNGGVGISVTGGQAVDDFAGGDAIVATGGFEGGIGLVASSGGGAAFDNGVPGIMTTGGVGGGSAIDGPGIMAAGQNEPGGIDGAGDGIDAIAGVGTGSANGKAGSFTGDVSISGNLNVSGTKSFKIDHPLDPANKYLYHAALESSEVLNLYSGNATLDAGGEATVQLPSWFEALNQDFRYQLTAIGAAAPNLHIAEEIQNNSFRISGGAAGMKVSWQVTGVRQDAWEKAHPMVVEVQKPERERGYYINPDLFGAPPERNMDWARNPQVMKRLRSLQQKQVDKQRAAQKQAKLAQPVKSTKP